MRIRFQALLSGLFLLLGLAACGDKPESAYLEGPKAYVEFYMPEARLGDESVDVDTQVYRIENGQREFLGMTRKWKHLAQPRRGLTVAVPPGEQNFVVVHENAEASVAVKLEEGAYLRVRIEMTGLSAEQVIGATRQLRFGLKATPEPAQ